MRAEKRHTVLLVPGLGDDKPGAIQILKSATADWHKAGLPVHIHAVHWRDGEAFDAKLANLLAAIDGAAAQGLVSLVGTSAGASLAFNAFLDRPGVVHKAVNVCGRLRAGQHTVRSLERMSRTSRAFHDSVQHFANRENAITPSQRQRLLTIRPFFGDELVPHDAAYLEGASNKWLFAPGHMLSIYLSLRFPAAIWNFLLQGT